MKKHMNIIRAYLFTIISFVVTLLAVYLLAKIAPQFYTGLNRYISENTLNIFVNILFIFLLSVNFIGVILCTFHTYKALSNKLGGKK